MVVGLESEHLGVQKVEQRGEERVLGKFIMVNLYFEIASQYTCFGTIFSGTEHIM